MAPLIPGPPDMISEDRGDVFVNGLAGMVGPRPVVLPQRDDAGREHEGDDTGEFPERSYILPWQNWPLAMRQNGTRHTVRTWARDCVRGWNGQKLLV